MIKAIETKYKGYRFRSRLEARWAVFFDALDIKWEYEQEGFKLSDGTLYLPDFFLRDLNLYIEIKATKEFAEEIYNKLYKFRDEIGAICIFWGNLHRGNLFGGDIDGKLFCWDLSDSSGGSSDFDIFWGYDENFTTKIISTARRERSFYSDENFSQPLDFVTYDRDSVYSLPENDHAIESFRSARFEHGETP